MDAKLTLKLNEEVIAKAKTLAKGKDISLSRLIENYLRAITNKGSKEFDISPLVESLTGIVQLKDVEDNKKSYIDYLDEKYS